MTVKELREALNKYPDNMEVLAKKTELLGNVSYVNMGNAKIESEETNGKNGN